MEGCCDFEMGKLDFHALQCVVLGITLSFLRLKLWGLLFWKDCFMPYHFDVLSFCICSAEKL